MQNLAQGQSTLDPPFSSVLKAAGDGSSLYTELYWNFNMAEQTIMFAVKARTNGWVSFGISLSSGMINSDGWMNDEGQAFLDAAKLIYIKSSIIEVVAVLIILSIN